mgnify:CR=1 FL=1
MASSHKLSATALSTFLKSPKQYYYRYILRLEPIQQQVANFDHDKLFGVLWAQFTDRFYKGESEASNIDVTRAAWLEQTEGWVPEKARDTKTRALDALMPQYYQTFSPDDGCRAPEKSELWLEIDRLCAKLDGLSYDGVVHEVKSTSRSPQLAEQLWKVQNSLQVRLYCVLADAFGHCVEFAFKDPPYQIFRGPVILVGDAQKQRWESELNALADMIYSLGDDPNNYPCHTDGCCLTTKGYVSMCQYQLLCTDGINENTDVFYKKRERK